MMSAMIFLGSISAGLCTICGMCATAYEGGDGNRSMLLIISAILGAFAFVFYGIAKMFGERECRVAVTRYASRPVVRPWERTDGHHS